MSRQITTVDSDGDDPRDRLKEYALLLPRLMRLLWRLARDPRVPVRSKAALLVLGAYLMSPVDVIPDFIPAIGHVDDLIIVVFALDQILNRIPDEIVKDHWDGEENVLELIRNVLDIASAFVPNWLKKRFGAS